MIDDDKASTRQEFLSDSHQEKHTKTGNLAQEVKADVKSSAEKIKTKAERETATQRDHAAEELETFKHATDAAAEALAKDDHEGLSHYVHEMSSTIGELAENLRHKSVDELVHDVEGLARKNPALFITGSIALGLGISRFAKARGSRHSSRSASSRNSSTATDNEHFAATQRTSVANASNQHTASSALHRKNEEVIF